MFVGNLSKGQQTRRLRREKNKFSTKLSTGFVYNCDGVHKIQEISLLRLLLGKQKLIFKYHQLVLALLNAQVNRYNFLLKMTF